MIVILELPEPAVGALRKFVRGILLIRFDKGHGIAVVFRPDGENVRVIRHDAVCMNEKIPFVCVLAELSDQPLRDAGVLAESPAIVEAKREEIFATAEVVSGREADVLAEEGFGGKAGHAWNYIIDIYVQHKPLSARILAGYGEVWRFLHLRSEMPR